MWKLFSKNQNQKLEIYAPVTGKIISLNQVPDPVFSQEMLGVGFAIIPDYQAQKGVSFVAPFSGFLATVFSTGHAYGIKDVVTGVECLVHIGIDTVELAGQGFEIKVQQGNSINRNDVMVFVMLQEIKENHKKEVITPIVFTHETMTGYQVNIVATGQVTQGQLIAEIIKK